MANLPSAGQRILRDLSASVVVFVVALPLCLGVALASNPGKDILTANPAAVVPLLAGLIAGVVGGIVVGLLSGSHTSVSGPAAGLTAVVAAQVAVCGSFSAFLAAVVLAGAVQIVFGILRGGFLTNFVPSSVIKGLLAAIGIILILKQLPHLVGHDPDPDGEMSFFQPDGRTTFTELFDTVLDIQPGACLVGLLSLAILVIWDRVKSLKKSPVPVALIVVGFGIAMTALLGQAEELWQIGPLHLVQVPVFSTATELVNGLASPDFSTLLNSKGKVLIAAITIAIVATLETLLNLEAVDKLDPKKRVSPANRELVAQGFGNMVSGMLGGLPVTSVIVRSSVNINAGGQTKLAAILHGVLLVGCVLLLPTVLNQIPLACLAAILIMTGWKLASWKIIKSVYKQGWSMFLPFIVTVVAIVLTDLLLGVIIGLCTSIVFILRSNVRKPLRRVLEKHVAGEVLHIQLANQVSFLNRASLATTLEEIPTGSHVLIDARETDFIDPDILDVIRTYARDEAPARGVSVSLLGLQDHYQLADRILYADYTSREVRDTLTPPQVLEILKDGHDRFRRGETLSRDLHRRITQTATGQAPLAAVLSCIDSRTPAEIILDLGVGDIFTVRVAGNILDERILGSLEFATKVAGAKLILVMGHTGCSAVNTTIDLLAQGADPARSTGCQHLGSVVDEIRHVVDSKALSEYAVWNADHKKAFADSVAKTNVNFVVQELQHRSTTLRSLVESGTIQIVGSVYDVRTGVITFGGTDPRSS